MFDYKKALSFSYPPFRLGFCGKSTVENKKKVENFLRGKTINEKEIIRMLTDFQGLYHYCNLIAKKNNIKNFWSPKVLEAYWLGNELLEKVKADDIRKMILEKFTLPGMLSQIKAREIVRKIPEGVVPHHSFHVLYVGSVTHTVEVKGRVRDLCRVSWGRVGELTIHNSQLTIIYRPLIFKGQKVVLGGFVRKKIKYNPDFVKVKKGDWVSFHWDVVCTKLNERERRNLEKYTLRNLNILC